MEEQNKTESFRFTYSAKEQKEIRQIREKYAPTPDQPDEEALLARLRALDRGVTRRGTVVSLTMGIVGTLLMGLGMSCCLVWMGSWFIPGVCIGVLGIASIALAYPVYARVTQKERERIAPEILRITDQLLL